MRERIFWIMDYETLVNCFIGVFERYNGKEIKTFIINRDINQIKELIEFLKENIKNKDWHLGYNNLAFDAQITEYLLEYADDFMKLNSEEITKYISDYANNIINKSSRGEWLDYPEFKLSIPCIDIYKLNHWDGAAKRTSLKWVQYSMDWFNVEEMPHHHTKPVITDKELNNIIEYCINDVASTKQIFLLKNAKGEQIMASQINLRSELSDTYKINLFSASEPKISREIFLHFLSNKLNKPKKELRNLRTFRSQVKLKDVILPTVRFSIPEFQKVHNWFDNQIIDTSIKGDVTESKSPKYKYRMWYKGVPTDYGLGGLHGCIKSGIYESTDKKKIKSVDVTSFYPNLAIRNKWSPAQINKTDFCTLYEWFFEERKKYPKTSPLNYLFKIVLNSTYGLSKEKHSFLYDPEFTFRITVNGQLQLSMLYEMIALALPNAQPIMQNTDGLEFLIDNEDEEKFFQVCKEWEKLTSLELESADYKKMIIGDVNNYIAVYDNGKTKCKGRFEYEELPLHKNKSHLIIPKALYAYFIHGTDPKEFLKENRNIFDYCAGAKLKGDWFFVERLIKEGVYSENKLQKLIRYYISEKGVKLIKCNPDGREIQLEAGKHMQTIFNKSIELPWEEYNVDEKYYLDKIYDEIYKIENSSFVLPQQNIIQQLKLF